jgi:hypothetical protein
MEDVEAKEYRVRPSKQPITEEERVFQNYQAAYAILWVLFGIVLIAKLVILAIRNEVSIECKGKEYDSKNFTWQRVVHKRLKVKNVYIVQ